MSATTRTKPKGVKSGEFVKLPAGGILRVFREGSISRVGETKARPWCVGWRPTYGTLLEDEEHLHTKTTMHSVAVDFLALTVFGIKPELIVFDPTSAQELFALWRAKCAEDPGLAKFKTQPALESSIQ